MRILFTCLAAIICFQLSAQTPDSLRIAEPDSTAKDAALSKRRSASKMVSESTTIDTSVQKAKQRNDWANRFFSKNYPNPRAAALLSMVIPGAGQAYNKKWWKIPIVWGALGGIAYGTFSTQKTYHELRDSYKLLVDGDPNTNPTESPYNTFDASRTKSYRDTYRGYTEKWFLALGVTYLLSVTDAFVDAHLAKFDVSDDLTMKFKPSFETSNGLPVFGLGISLSLSQSRDAQSLKFTHTRP
jgi:hypothetical protein